MSCKQSSAAQSNMPVREPYCPRCDNNREVLANENDESDATLMPCPDCRGNKFALDVIDLCAQSRKIFSPNAHPHAVADWIEQQILAKYNTPTAAPAPSPTPSLEAAKDMGAKGGPLDEGERLAFEAWMKGHCWALCATWNGKGYVSDAEQGGLVCPQATRTRGLWAAWRDRAALAKQG